MNALKEKYGYDLRNLAAVKQDTRDALDKKIRRIQWEIELVEVDILESRQQIHRLKHLKTQLESERIAVVVDKVFKK